MSAEDALASAVLVLSTGVKLTSKCRERIFRDAAVREAARRGEPHQDIAGRYGLSVAAVSRIAVTAGIHRRKRS